MLRSEDMIEIVWACLEQTKERGGRTALRRGNECKRHLTEWLGGGGVRGLSRQGTNGV